MLERHARKWWMGLVVVVCAIAMTSAAAEAQGKRRKGKSRSEGAPASPAISQSMGDLEWGMSKDDVLRWTVNNVKEKYRGQLAKTHDAIAEDRLRHQMQEEIRKVKDSFVRFEGRTTGWDVSFLRDEFTHNNNEAMIVVRDQNSQNFYFFINNKLWKWYKAFDAKVFQGKSFGEFAGAIQGRFGEGKAAQGELTPGSGAKQWLEWQDDKSRLRAVDQTKFYGFYCLVFEDKDTVSKLASLRRNAPKRRAETHALVDSVTSTGRDSAQPDDAPNVVDRITGKSRQRQQPASASSGKPRGKGGAASAPPAVDAVSTGVSADDDPLRGLDF